MLGFLGIGHGFIFIKWIYYKEFFSSNIWELIIYGFMFLFSLTTIMILVNVRRASYNQWVLISISTLIMKSWIDFCYTKNFILLAIIGIILLIFALGFLLWRAKDKT
jgi:hypothetical protein